MDSLRHASPPLSFSPKALLLDLDGTVYRGADEVPGASGFLRHALARGIRCLYVTNRSNRPAEVVRDQLRGYGLPCETRDVITTADATARFVGGGSAYVVGEEGLHRALREHGIRETDTAPDTVVVSIDREFTYRKLDIASSLIRAGARYVATNTDACLATEDRLIPGTGSIVAAVSTAARRQPDATIGKPGRILFDYALEEAGCTADEALAIGDNLVTDIAAGVNAGIRTVLLLTGISRREDVRPDGPHPTWIAEDYAELSHLLFSGEQT